MKNICICGGGNLGHVVAGFIASLNRYDVNILTNHPDKWNNNIEIITPNDKVLNGHINKISNEPKEVIPKTDIVIICLPGNYIREEIQRIRNYLKENTIVGTIVSNTGFFFQAHELLKDATLFGFQRVPFISRIVEYGKRAKLLGFKQSLNVCIENTAEVETLRKILQDMFQTPINLLNNFYEVSLSNSNPLLHPARLYTMWHNWNDTIVYPKQSLFYEQWTDEASQLLIDMDDEFQTLLTKLPVKKGSIPSILEYYESTDATSLTNKIRSIEAFKTILSPMIKTDKGFIPDFQSRYFTEDFEYGTLSIQQTAQQHKVSTPKIDMVCKWYIDFVKTRNITNKCKKKLN